MPRLTAFVALGRFVSHTVICTVAFAAVARAQDVAATGSGGDLRATRVTVSRNELRVVFPPERGGEAARRRDGTLTPTRYWWQLMVDTPDGPQWLGVAAVQGDSLPRRSDSLRELIGQARTETCDAGWPAQCRAQPGLTATVEAGRVVLSLRDSASIARLFALRPRHVLLRRSAPADGGSAALDSVPVRYIAPRLPEPDSAEQAANALAIRRYEATVNWRYYRIGIDRPEGDAPPWVLVGDSLRLGVRAVRCRHDLCMVEGFDAPDSSWRISDPRVATLSFGSAADVTGRRLIGAPPRVWLVARRPGRVVVRAEGLPPTEDAEPSSRPVPPPPERTVLVTHPLTRVEISPRPEIRYVGDEETFWVRATDTSGAVFLNPPADVRVKDGTFTREHRDPQPLHLRYDRPGLHTLTATLGGRADTVRVLVRERPPRPVPPPTAEPRIR